MGKFISTLTAIVLLSGATYGGFVYAKSEGYITWNTDKKTECHSGVRYKIVQGTPGKITMVREDDKDDKPIPCTK